MEVYYIANNSIYEVLPRRYSCLIRILKLAADSTFVKQIIFFS